MDIGRKMCAVKDTKLNIRIDTQTKKVLEETSEKTGLSMSYIIRWLVSHFAQVLTKNIDGK